MRPGPTPGTGWTGAQSIWSTTTANVVGFDGSEHARKALERAAELAGEGTSVDVVCAADVSRLMRDPAGGVNPVDPADAEARAEALEPSAGRSMAAATEPTTKLPMN